MVLTPTAKREQAVAIGERFERAVSMVFVDFRGIDVGLITELRARFRAAGVEYKVVKNNLVRKALVDSPLAENEAVDQGLRGPTGIAWSYEDPSAAARGIKAFRKEGDEQEKLVVTLGILEGEVLEASQVEGQLATMPGKDEIRAPLLAQLMAPAQTLVRQLLAPSQSMVHVLDARRRDQEQAPA